MQALLERSNPMQPGSSFDGVVEGVGRQNVGVSSNDFWVVRSQVGLVN